MRGVVERILFIQQPVPTVSPVFGFLVVFGRAGLPLGMSPPPAYQLSLLSQAGCCHACPPKPTSLALHDGGTSEWMPAQGTLSKPYQVPQGGRQGFPGMSPVGCKQKASFRHEAADNSLRKQGGLNTDLGGSSEGLLLGKTDELGVPQEWWPRP